jgi:hypothetical protein
MLRYHCFGDVNVDRRTVLEWVFKNGAGMFRLDCTAIE